MVRGITLATMALCTLAAPCRALDLTPIPFQEQQDGVTLDRLRFIDGAASVNYTQPPGWATSYIGNALLLRPEGATRAVARIAVDEDAKAIIPFDDQGITRLREAFLAGLPEGATDPKSEAEEVNPFRVAGHDSLLLIASYTLRGERYRTSTVYVNLTKRRLRFEFLAPETVFQGPFEQFRRSLFSWYWVPKEPAQ